MLHIGFIAALCVGFVGSAPAGVDSIEARTVPCDPISKYTVSWFYNHKSYTESLNDQCLFYTAYLSATAKRFAHSTSSGGAGLGLETIWDLWPCNLYNGDVNDLNNPLRCFFQEARAGNKANQTLYFRHMSEAMAQSCNISAYVMTNNPHSIPTDGIWYQTEYPTLMRLGNPGGEVDVILAFNTSGDDLTEVWERPESSRKTPTRVESAKPTATTSDPADRCYSPDQIQTWFGDVGW